MAPLTRLRYGLARMLLGVKQAEMPFISSWIRHSFLNPTFDRLTAEGFEKNSIVAACVAALTFKYDEPTPAVLDADGEPQPNHPLQRLLDRPNPMMTHAELMRFVIQYKAIGGNAYIHKVRGRGGQVVELWPYHAGQVSPVPGRFSWVEAYEFDDGSGDKTRVPPEDVIHLKWPIVDLRQPWLALPPLKQVAYEVDTDNEMTAYLYALLKNDAVPRGVVTLPPQTGLSGKQADKLREEFYFRHGGQNRGNIAILEQGATYNRASLNLQELAFDAMRHIPESRISGVFRVPAILAGLYTGLERATYANYGEARQQLTEDTFVPLWKSDAQEWTHGLAVEYGTGLQIEYDLSSVAALQENEDAKYTRILSAFDSGVVTKNEARIYLGLPRVGELQIVDEGDAFKTSTPAPQPPMIDVTPEPRQLTTAAYPYPLALKAKREDSTQTLEERMKAEVEAYLKRQYEDAAANV